MILKTTYLRCFAIIALTLLALQSIEALPLTYYIIPQNGMYPNFPSGSLIIVSKWAYANAETVKRGDVVVFSRKINGQSYDFIWRVVGLPGESLQVDNGKIAISAKSVNSHFTRQIGTMTLHREEIDNLSYEIAFQDSLNRISPAVSKKLSRDQFFLMGDNRSDALDSRYLGPIDFNEFRGKLLWAIPRD